MKNDRSWLIDTKIIAATKGNFMFSLILHAIVAVYIFFRFFLDMAGSNWMMDGAAFILGGLTPIYQVLLIRKLFLKIDKQKF